jgi:hypothetical protein
MLPAYGEDVMEWVVGGMGGKQASGDFDDIGNSNVPRERSPQLLTSQKRSVQHSFKRYLSADLQQVRGGRTECHERRTSST